MAARASLPDFELDQTPFDSLVRNYFAGQKAGLDSVAMPSIPDSAYFSSFDLKDSLLKGLRATSLTGVVGLQHEFGLLAAYLDTGSRITNVLRAQGDVTVSSFGLPLKVSYSYSNFRNPIGVNNYFRISLDLEQMKKERMASKEAALGEIDDKLGDVQHQKDALKGKMGYSEVIMQALKQQIADRQAQLLARQAELTAQMQQYKDSVSGLADTTGLGDKAAGHLPPKLDSMQQSVYKLQSEVTKYVLIYDSVNKIYTTINNLYTTYSDLEGQLGKQKEQVAGYAGMYSQGGKPSLDAGWLKYLKKADLGLTYPQLTGLSKNSVPVKGLDVEFQKGMWYSAFTAGVMMNNLMVSNDLVQNKLFNSQNAFNQFDFQEVKHKQFLVNVKSGYGTKAGTHAFIGFRYTNRSVLAETTLADTAAPAQPSFGLELDLRYLPKFSPNTKIDFVYGKTSKASSVEPSTRGPLGSLFSSDRTHSSLLKVTQSVPKLRSEVELSARWIDPFADTRSLGVLQPNNLRYEVRTSHAITSRFRVGFDYRKDRNNVDNKRDTTLRMEMIGGQFNGEVGRVFTYYGSVNYLQQFSDRATGTVKGSDNYIIAGGITARYTVADIKNAASVLYNTYRISDSTGLSSFSNFSIQNITLFDKMQNTFTVSRFVTSMAGQPASASIIIGDEYGIKREGWELKVGVKISQSQEYGSDLGGKVEYKRLFFNQLQWIFRGEKLVLGDYYNAYDLNRFKQFPYAFSTTLNYLIQ